MSLVSVAFVVDKRVRRYSKFSVLIYRWKYIVKIRYIASRPKHARVSLRRASCEIRDDVILYFGFSPFSRRVVLYRSTQGNASSVYGVRWTIGCLDFIDIMMVNIRKKQNIRESRYSDIFSIAIPSISANSNIVKKRYTEIPTDIIMEQVLEFVGSATLKL